MRHETRSEAQDRRAEQQFATTSGLNGAGVDAELARPPRAACPHVTPSLCARHGPHQEPHDPCPWITFYIGDDGEHVKIAEHAHSRDAQIAAVERNCMWGRIISVFPSGNFVVERGPDLP